MLAILLILQTACVSPAQQIKAERKPFQKSSVVIKSPTQHENRELANSKSYDPKPKFVVIDEKTGKYELRWIGYDGKEKVISYQRIDSIHGIVEARVIKSEAGKFIYKYLIKILPTSPIYFKEFIVQTLAKDAKPIKIENDDFYVGDMSREIRLFQDGVWWNFAYVGEKEATRIVGGRSIEFQIISSSQPGLVGGKASGGEHVLKGVGEDMPSELESAIPGYEELAWGYTIGPVESLSTLSKSERVKYLLDNLQKFQEAGWMSEGTAKNYQTLLKKEDLTGVLEKAKKDFENEFITSEVLQIIEGLNQ